MTRSGDSEINGHGRFIVRNDILRWGGSRGGGGPGVQGPPLVPREGVLDPSSKMKKTAFIIFSFI